MGVAPETRESCRDLLDLQLSVEFSGRLADGILLAIDKTSMAHSLEVRMPFLDREVVEFAHRLPSSMKVQGKSMKRVLAPLVEALPPEVAGRRKQGLHVPPRISRSDVFRRFYTEVLLESPVSRELFDWRQLEAWVGARNGPLKSRATELWPLCHFVMWWNHHILGGAVE
jgi:asparagine synthase (glutamine-hydrolysing)